MLVLQFLTVLEPRLTARIVRSSAPLDAVTILDLEDALWDVLDERRTAALKARGRQDLIALATDHPSLFRDQRVGVRLNRLTSPESTLDVEALAAVSRIVTFEAVVVPKVESADEIAEWADRLRSHGIRYRAIVPIVETVTGVADVDRLVAGARLLGVDWVVYGHYDYALDAGWWPVPDHDAEAFWSHVTPLIARFEAARIGYVHPPFFAIDDPVRFDAILRRLSQTCGRDFGILTIGARQTSWAADPAAARIVPERPPTRGRQSEDPTTQARRIVEAFRAYRRPTTSWVVDPVERAFLSPHLYLAAKAYLERKIDA